MVVSVIAVYVPDMVDKNHLPKLAHTYQEGGGEKGVGGSGKGLRGKGLVYLPDKKDKSNLPRLAQMQEGGVLEVGVGRREVILGLRVWFGLNSSGNSH